MKALYYLCSVSLVLAQETSITPIRPSGPFIVRPYKAALVPPIRLSDSLRVRDLIRGGTLYLTAQDAITLALENNIDIEVARYNPLISFWQLERSQAGGALPGVPSSASQAGAVASGQGVAGSQAAAGVSGGGSGGGGASVGNATVSQVGPVTQNLDPALQETTVFSHVTTPESNTVQSVLSILQSNTRVYSGSFQQGFLTGGTVTVNYSDHYLRENAPTDILNPSSSVNLGISLQHNLLRGFGQAVNSRTIRISKINVQTSELNFRTEVVNTVVSVLNLYYNLVASYEDVRAKRSASATAQEFLQNSRRMEALGTVSPNDVDTAQGQVTSTGSDLFVSETNLRQQEVQLKNDISRGGVLDPVLAEVRIMPLDRIEVPDEDDLPPLKDLAQKAFADRSDLAVAQTNITTAEISALGTKNGVLPSLQVLAGESQSGLAGVRSSRAADPYFVGDIGTALGQAFRRNFPSERVGAFLQASIGNRQAQADYGIDQLQLRQTQLTTQKDFNQVVVDLQNGVVALRQARARYKAAVQNRILDEQLLEAEQKKFVVGASTPYNVIQQQRDLAVAHSTEVAAMVAYSNARVALDQALGATLAANHVSLEEARSGTVTRSSSLPSVLPQ